MINIKLINGEIHIEFLEGGRQYLLKEDIFVEFFKGDGSLIKFNVARQEFERMVMDYYEKIIHW